MSIFFRTQKKKEGTYLVAARSYRKGKKVINEHIASFGRIDKLAEKGTLQKLAKKLLSLCENREYYSIASMEEKDRQYWGAVAVLKALWKQFNLDQFFQKILKNRKIAFQLVSTIFLLTLDRFMDPKSRLQTAKEQYSYYGVEEVQLHHLYRALDFMAENKKELEKFLFRQSRDLFNMEVDLVLYDVTTLYFESVRPDEGEDGLKDFGFSKDQKFGEVQVVFGLLVNSDGRPIGFEVFRGNTFEGHTLEKSLEKLKRDFEVSRIIVVGDRGMLSEANLEILEDLGYEYIVGYRLKSGKKAIEEEVFNEEGYETVSIANGSEGEEEVFKWKAIEVNDKRSLLVAYSSRRAEKDRKDRERLVKQALKAVEEGRSKSQARQKLSRGVFRYLRVEGVKEVGLAEDKIKADEKWDGYYGIITNTKKFRGVELFQKYHDLWKVEEAFRMFKSHMEVRPMYVWSPKRILGHLTVAFLAYALEKSLLCQLEKKGIRMSGDRLRKTLLSLQVSTVEIEGTTFLLRSKISPEARNVLKTLKIKPPESLTQKTLFSI